MFRSLLPSTGFTALTEEPVFSANVNDCGYEYVLTSTL